MTGFMVCICVCNVEVYLLFLILINETEVLVLLAPSIIENKNKFIEAVYNC